MTTVTGTNQNDNLVGTNGSDTINGRQGNDVIAGLAGNDTIVAGNGNNTITDGDGNDTITAGNGNNTITAGNGTDTVAAGNGNNNITVGNGTDTVTVGNGINTITAGSGADTITAGNGGDTIFAGAGNDVIHTGNGNDTVDAGAGNDQVFTTGGNDLVIYNMSANIGSHDAANGGKGTDTVQLELTQQQFNSAAVQADLAAYHTFLAAHQTPGSDTGPAFHFTAFDLTVSNFETVNVVIVNSPVVISSGPESSTVTEQDNTTGSAAPDTTPTAPAGTLNFTDADTGDTHTVAVTLASTSSAVPAATQADLAHAVTTVLHDSTGTGSGSIDWNFAIPDKDLDYLSAGQTLTVDYNVKVSDGPTSSTQTVEVVITGANDAVAITSGPQSDTVAEQANTQGSFTPDSTATHTLNFYRRGPERQPFGERDARFRGLVRQSLFRSHRYAQRSAVRAADRSARFDRHGQRQHRRDVFCPGQGYRFPRFGRDTDHDLRRRGLRRCDDLDPRDYHHSNGISQSGGGQSGDRVRV
jgi:VCBS repeat-containing protein